MHGLEDIPLVLDNMEATEELLTEMRDEAEGDNYTRLNLALLLLTKARVEIREVGKTCQ